MNKEHAIKLALIGILAVLVFKFGVMAFFESDPKNNGWAGGKLERDKNTYDVIVLGEEPEGIAAAVSAARMGARTLLVCEGADLGGMVSRSMLGTLEVNLGDRGQLLNKGIFSEIYNKLGNSFSVKEYISCVEKLVKSEKRHLDVLYNTAIGAPDLQGGTLAGIHLSIGGKDSLYPGQRFIDATQDGKVLKACGVPYFTGSEDLNMKGSFLPLQFNFEVSAPSRGEMKRAISTFTTSGSAIMANYKPENVKVRINHVALYDQGDGTAIISGIQYVDTDPTDSTAMKSAYQGALNAAKDLAAYLSQEIKEFGPVTFNKGADAFYIRERDHYAGEYTLSVNDILDNRNFFDKISLGSSPIEAGKFADYRDNIVGKPVLFSVPLGCIIPRKVDNLLMPGGKASYSSLAASSAGTISVNISTGEAAGVEAVYSLAKGITVRELLKKTDTGEMQEYLSLLERQKMYLPDFEVKETNPGNPAFQAVRELRNIGLLAGGMDNNYYYAETATEEDLALLLLNGVYRLSPKEYSLKMDANLRKFFTGEKLTKDRAGGILAAFYGVSLNPEQAYEKACSRGYINDEMQSKLRDVSVLKREDVYMLAAYNIKIRTGREMN